MQYFISAGILFLTINALLYATNEVWPKAEYDRVEASLITRMQTDAR
mgnify:CR=1 FL=1